MNHIIAVQTTENTALCSLSASNRGMPKPRLLRLIERMAELRAAGVSWPAIAEAVNRPTTTIEAWIRQYRTVWERLLNEAESRKFREAGAEALPTLRKLLRSKDEKETRDVARTLATLLYRLPMERGPKEAPVDAETQCLRDLNQKQAEDDAFWADVEASLSEDEVAEI